MNITRVTPILADRFLFVEIETDAGLTGTGESGAWGHLEASAAAIAAQGLLRLGRYFGGEAGARYTQAGLTVLHTLCAEPYLSTDPGHQGLLLHSVYHRPNGWDHVPEGRKVPCGESSMWGDYHLREAALYVQRLAEGGPYLTFWA